MAWESRSFVTAWRRSDGLLLLLCNSRGRWRSVGASSLKAIRMPWEIFRIISGKVLANGTGSALEGRLGRMFGMKLSLGGGGLSGLAGGLFLGISAKGLTRRPMVGVFWSQSGESVQRRLVRKGTRRTCWRRWLLSGGLISTFSFVEDSGDELHLPLQYSSSTPALCMR